MPVLALPVFTDGLRLGNLTEKGSGGGVLGVFTRCFGIGRNGRLPDYRDFSGSSPLLGSGGCCLSRRPALRRDQPQKRWVKELQEISVQACQAFVKGLPARG